MCYDIKYLTQKKLNYAKRMGESPEEIIRIENDLNILTKNVSPQFHSSGFSLPNILCFINKSKKMQPYLLRWGLIPFWTRDEASASKIQNRTINARIETINEKPSFKESYKKRRCIILIDGFYEHYHLNHNTYPFYIFHKEEKPLTIAGIWDNWLTHDKKTISTTSIITTKAQGIMSKIHNNPKLKESRMPLILTENQINEWLSEDIKYAPEEFCNNKEYENLNAFTVRPLRGKNYIGNIKEVSYPFEYPELNIQRLIS